MSPSDLLEWQAFYTLEASEQDPEVTEWDDDESAKRKLTRAAMAKEAARRRT